MSTNSRLIAVLYFFVHLIGPVFSQVDYSQHVNPLIGSEGPIPGLAYGGG
jgi:hypothetical protein